MPSSKILIDFDADEVRLKSAVTGAFILKQVADPEAVLESLIAITKAADQAASISREYFVILGRADEVWNHPKISFLRS